MRALLHAYSQVIFARSWWVGALLLLATLAVPSVALAGLLGASLSLGAAWVLGFDRQQLRDGLLGYDGLLTGLVVGATLQPGPVLLLVGALAAVLVVVIHVGLGAILRYHLRLPVLSLPFLIATWTLLAAAPYLRGLGPRLGPAWTWVPGISGPDALSALGALFAVPGVLPGALVLLALFAWSRVATVHTLVGLGVWALAERLLVDVPLGVDAHTLGFNAVLSAVALGGVFFVPGPASLASAAVGAALTVLAGVAAGPVLAPLGLPVLTLPFNLVALTALYALALRRPGMAPVIALLPGRSPEETLQRWATRVRRFRRELPVRLRLPVRGRWVVTQGNDGEHTHKGRWRHGLDFEVQGANGQRCRGEGKRLKDWYCYGLPVCAPADGTVVEIADGHADTPVGEVETDHPFGNLVILQHAPGLFSMVAHLQAGSLLVREGDRVVAGAPLGKVGASGRAPVPHLHFQLQGSAIVGDGTLPVRFHGVIEGERMHDALLPAEGQVVANIQRDEALGAALSLPPGTRLRSVVDEEEREVVAEIDALGGRSLHEPDTGARLWYDEQDDTFIVWDYQGPRDGALFALYTALPRLPLQASALRWADYLDPRRLRGSALSWLGDSLGAFVPRPTIAMEYASSRDEEGRLVVRGSGELRTEVVIETGVIHLRVGAIVARLER